MQQPVVERLIRETDNQSLPRLPIDYLEDTSVQEGPIEEFEEFLREGRIHVLGHPAVIALDPVVEVVSDH